MFPLTPQVDVNTKNPAICSIGIPCSTHEIATIPFPIKTATDLIEERNCEHFQKHEMNFQLTQNGEFANAIDHQNNDEENSNIQSFG